MTYSICGLTVVCRNLLQQRIKEANN